MVTQVITTLKSSFQIGEINTHERTGKIHILKLVPALRIVETYVLV